jgi:hypothetical protein
MNRTMSICLALAMAASAHIQKGSLSVKSGTVYTVGQIVTISWSAEIDHNKSNYNLWFSSDSGKTWTSVKTGIPGQASGVLVNYSWTVPDKPTTKGMIRVFQTFGGTVATSPSNPGDYTLFSPVFQIKATSAVAAPHASSATSLRVVGDRVAVRFSASSSRTASVEVLDLDGSRLGSRMLSSVGSGADEVMLPLRELGVRGRAVVRLRLDGRVVAQEMVSLFP